MRFSEAIKPALKKEGPEEISMRDVRARRFLGRILIYFAERKRQRKLREFEKD